MLGFLITALAVIVGLSDKPFLKSYTHYGYFSEFGMVYLATLFSLLASFALSTVAIVDNSWLAVLFALIAINVVQIIMVSFLSYKLIFKH